MSHIPRWLIPAAGIIVPLPSYAVQYLSVPAAQKECFPECDQFLAAHIRFTAEQVRQIEARSNQKELLRGQEVWKATQRGRLIGYFIVDYVIGKHLVIDYAVALSAGGTVRQVEILNYRESYGGEIRNPDWRKQFIGKKPDSRFGLNQGIVNISGATLSSRHVTEGVKRVLATYAVCLRPE
jgi:Na+-translocating ferredoxin:NAD+ oxidoreductase RnfG subunit